MIYPFIKHKVIKNMCHVTLQISLMQAVIILPSKTTLKKLEFEGFWFLLDFSLPSLLTPPSLTSF